MSAWGTAAGAFVGALVLTTALRAAGEMRLTRMDLPFLLGTAVTVNRTRAKAVGYLMHFLNGEIFAFVYYAVFLAIGMAGWWLGTLFGLLHGLFAGTALVGVLLPLVHPRMGSPLTSAPEVALLEPPGFLMLNYGPSTPVITEHTRNYRPRPHRVRRHRRRLHPARCLAGRECRHRTAGIWSPYG